MEPHRVVISVGRQDGRRHGSKMHVVVSCELYAAEVSKEPSVEQKLDQMMSKMSNFD
jgi:hypothetical protein